LPRTPPGAQHIEVLARLKSLSGVENAQLSAFSDQHLLPFWQDRVGSESIAVATAIVVIAIATTTYHRQPAQKQITAHSLTHHRISKTLD
jgi:hypothetical protein